MGKGKNFVKFFPFLGSICFNACALNRLGGQGAKQRLGCQSSARQGSRAKSYLCVR